MQRWKGLFVLFLAILPANVFAQRPSQASLEKAKAELHRVLDAKQIAGAIHMVVQDGQTVYLETVGFCDIEDKRPMKADSIVRIYSMSKPITSVAAMTLYEQGKFQLDDPISKFIPAFEKTSVLTGDGDDVQLELVPAERPITVRDLLRHTSGWNYGGGKMSKYYKAKGVLYRPPHGMLPPDMSIEDATNALAAIPTLHQPGKRFTYGFNTDILGRLIEIWSGQSLDKYLNATLFEPLEMTDTGFAVPATKKSRFASCHTMQDGKLVIADKAASSPYNDGFAFLSGGGGLVSTVQDYANFCQMMVDGGQFKGRRILADETVKLMFSDQLNGAGGDFRFGLGFAIADIKLGSGEQQQTAAQYSWAGYASTDFRLVPEKKMFQIVIRQCVPSKHGLANRLFGIVYEGVQ